MKACRKGDFVMKADVVSREESPRSSLPSGLRVADLPAGGPPAEGRHVFLSEMTADVVGKKDFVRVDFVMKADVRQQGRVGFSLLQWRRLVCDPFAQAVV
jgi:hypothetical protein